MMWAISTAVAVIPLLVWGLRVYLARMNQAAVERERKAGADENQLEAMNAEMDRVARGAAAAGGVRPQARDPNDRDGA